MKKIGDFEPLDRGRGAIQRDGASFFVNEPVKMINKYSIVLQMAYIVVGKAYFSRGNCVEKMGKK